MENTGPRRLLRRDHVCRFAHVPLLGIGVGTTGDRLLGKQLADGGLSLCWVRICPEGANGGASVAQLNTLLYLTARVAEREFSGDRLGLPNYYRLLTGVCPSPRLQHIPFNVVNARRTLRKHNAHKICRAGGARVAEPQRLLKEIS